MFGGLHMCSLEAVVGKDDSEHIIEVNDCAMTLMGETVAEDRDMIADLVMKEMEVIDGVRFLSITMKALQKICVSSMTGRGKCDTSEDVLEDVHEKPDNISRTDSHGE